MTLRYLNKYKAIFALTSALSAFALSACSLSTSASNTDQIPVVNLQYKDSDQGHYSFEVSQASALINAPIDVRLVGLQAGQVVNLTATTEDGDQQGWRSQASFKANAKGIVDLTQMAPISGTYDQVSAMGLFWSMRPVSGDGYFSLNKNFTVKINAHANQKLLAQIDIHRLSPLETSSVVKKQIRGDDLIANFFHPDAPGPYPSVIYLTGSGGGLANIGPALLASQGFAVLSVAYFGKGALPENLVSIPIEYFDTAIDWLNNNPLTKNMPMAILGGSRGSEAAILAAARHQVFDAVIAVVPSAVVWPAPGFAGYRHSAWSLHDKEIPQLEVGLLDGIKWYWQVTTGQHGIISRNMFVNALKKPRAVAAALLPVEQIKAPILFISGQQDLNWPSTEMANMLMKKLETVSFPYTHQHLALPDAGHGFGLPYIPFAMSAQQQFVSGGTHKGNALGAIQAHQQLVSFLKQHLNQSSNDDNRVNISDK